MPPSNGPDTESFQIFLSLPEPALLVSPEAGVVLDANRRAEDLFGRPRSHLVGERLALLLLPPRPHERARLLLIDPERARDERPEARVAMVGGEPVPVEIRAADVPWGSEQLLLLVLRDVSALHRAATALIAADEKTRRSARELRQLMEEFPEPLFEADASGRLLYLNRFGREATGLSRHDIASGVTLVELFPDLTAGDLEAHIEAILDNRITPEHPHALRFADGTVRAVVIRAIPRHLGDGKAGLLAAVSRIAHFETIGGLAAESMATTSADEDDLPHAEAA